MSTLASQLLYFPTLFHHHIYLICAKDYLSQLSQVFFVQLFTTVQNITTIYKVIYIKPYLQMQK